MAMQSLAFNNPEQSITAASTMTTEGMKHETKDDAVGVGTAESSTANDEPCSVFTIPVLTLADMSKTQRALDLQCELSLVVVAIVHRCVRRAVSSRAASEFPTLLLPGQLSDEEYAVYRQELRKVLSVTNDFIDARRGFWALQHCGLPLFYVADPELELDKFVKQICSLENLARKVFSRTVSGLDNVAGLNNALALLKVYYAMRAGKTEV
jgi:hypothetical protein